MQRHHVGAVAEGLVGVGVHLQEEPVHPHRHGRPSQGGHELPLAAGGWFSLRASCRHQREAAQGLWGQRWLKNEHAAAPGVLTIRPAAHSRAGWAEAAAAFDPDGLLDAMGSTRFDDEEWSW